MKDKRQSFRRVVDMESGAKAPERGGVVVPEVVDGGTYAELVNAIGEREAGGPRTTLEQGGIESVMQCISEKK